MRERRAGAQAVGRREGRAGMLGEQGRASRRPLVRKVIEGQDAACDLDVADQQACELAVDQILRAGLGEAPQRSDQTAERQVRRRAVGAGDGRRPSGR